MDEERVIDEMIDMLDENGELKFSSYDQEVFIQSIDDKEGYAYVSDTNEEFGTSREAVEWALDQFGGLEYVEEWE